jgi:hypothetical protein
MTSDAKRYNLKVGDRFQDCREGCGGEFEIIDITHDGNAFQLRWATMKDNELCPYVSAGRIFEIAQLDGNARCEFTYDDMLLAFAAGFKSSAEGYNGECNDFTDNHIITAREILSIEAAQKELKSNLERFLTTEFSFK